MAKFGLQSVKILALVCTTLLLVFAVAVTIRSANFRNIWALNHEELGTIFQKAPDIGFFFGMVIVIVTLFGFMAICMNGYGMLIFYNILLIIVALTMLVNGMLISSELRNENCKTLIKLKSVIHSFKIEQLDNIQKNFRCCGIEKYTDYLMLWEIWDKNYTASASPSYTGRPIRPGASKTKAPIRPVADSRSIVSKLKKKSWREVPFAVEVEGGIEYTTEIVITNEPTRVWKAAKPQVVDTKKIYKSMPNYHGHSFGEVSTWFVDIWRALEGPLKAYTTSRSIHGVTRSLYDKLVPATVQIWVSAVINYISEFAGWMASPMLSLYKWWYGSGWDKVLFQSLNPRMDNATLPYSCCKNPTKWCRGEIVDTWLHGCRDTLLYFWRTSNLELSILFMAYFMSTFVTILVIYIFVGGIKEKYYF